MLYILKMSIKAESIVKEFLESEAQEIDSFGMLKFKLAIFTIVKKNWDIFEKILNIVYNLFCLSLSKVI